jgi:hypothetical protein
MDDIPVAEIARKYARAYLNGKKKRAGPRTMSWVGLHAGRVTMPRVSWARPQSVLLGGRKVANPSGARRSMSVRL